MKDNSKVENKYKYMTYLHTHTHEQTYTNGHTKTDVGNLSQLSNLRMHKMPNIPNRIKYFFISVFKLVVNMHTV